MAKNRDIKTSYQYLIDWNRYRLEQNKQSLEKLLTLLPKLDRELEADKMYEADIDDLESLRIIYETGIRNFESQIDRYQKLIDTE
ncbi:hypothetical protein L0657_24255 [Dyadobacter sp. CY345]|uniref:hypothetical protein n=1 Tax=Dyadobacter sp. CY345 TaxID=2909335 RepID=UPI001F352AC4|nr:hypothetical protein [Dyadobacter sp. CY345]MCF2447089.1 hypothetical protein [Dyadobacter sp. CY345]